MIETPVRVSSAEIDPVVTRRPLRTRFSMAHLVMVVAALVAFTLVLVALRDRSLQEFIAVAAIDLEQGSRVGAGDVELRRVPADALETLGDLIDAAEMQAALDDGAVATRSLAAGTTLRIGDLRRDAEASTSLRVMSIEIEAARAAGGSLEVGDAVDIVSGGADDARLIADGVEVVAVRSGSGGFGSSSLVLSLAVEPSTALSLAAAVAGGDVFVLRATGAGPFVTGSG